MTDNDRLAVENLIADPTNQDGDVSLLGRLLLSLVDQQQNQHKQCKGRHAAQKSKIADIKRELQEFQGQAASDATNFDAKLFQLNNELIEIRKMIEERSERRTA